MLTTCVQSMITACHQDDLNDSKTNLFWWHAYYGKWENGHLSINTCVEYLCISENLQHSGVKDYKSMSRH